MESSTLNDGGRALLQESIMRQQNENVGFFGSHDPNLSYVQNLFSLFGLNSMMKRFIIGVSVGFLAEYVIKPSYSFDKSSGKPKSWAITNGGQPGSTYIPFWIVPIILGGFVGFYL